MKTLTLAAIRCSLIFTAVAALSIAYPASVQAVPTTYVYTGNPFTFVSGPYTMSDFVSGMLTLAGPLPPNFSGTVTPTAFTFSDGVQTITNIDGVGEGFFFATSALLPAPHIGLWEVIVVSTITQGGISSFARDEIDSTDSGVLDLEDLGFNVNMLGTWRVLHVADSGTSLSLMTLTLTALGVAARRFKRGAA